VSVGALRNRVGESRRRRRNSLSDAEFAENAPQQVVAGQFAGYFTESLLGQAQLLGQELARAGVGQRPATEVEVGAGPCQRVELPASRGAGALAEITVTGKLPDRRAQFVDAGAR